MDNRPTNLKHLDLFEANTLDLGKEAKNIHVERAENAIEPINIGIVKVKDRFGNELDILSDKAIKILLKEFGLNPVTGMLHRKLNEILDGIIAEDNIPIFCGKLYLLEEVARMNEDEDGNELDVFSLASIKKLTKLGGKKQVTLILHSKLDERIENNRIENNVNILPSIRIPAAHIRIMEDSPIYSKKNAKPLYGKEGDCLVEKAKDCTTVKPIMENFSKSEFQVLQNILGGELGIRSSNCNGFKKNPTETITSITLLGEGAQKLLNEIEREIYRHRLNFTLRK